MDSRSRWLRGLKCGFAVACLLGFRVRTQTETRMFSLLGVVWCQVEVTASVWSHIRKILSECGVSECDLKTSRMRRLRLTRAIELQTNSLLPFPNFWTCSVITKKNIVKLHYFCIQTKFALLRGTRMWIYLSLRYSVMTLNRKLMVCFVVISEGGRLFNWDYPFGVGFFFLILAHPVYKMWITQEPNTLEIWNKLHFEEKRTESIYHV